MDVTVKIESPELVAAIYTLATALENYNRNTIQTQMPEMPATVAPAPMSVVPPMQQTQPVAPAMPQVPQFPQYQQQGISVPNQAYQTGVSVNQPYQTGAAAPAMAPVPTAPQTYSQEQLAVAATQLMDAGRRQELVSLLSAFGVQALTSLPKEQYGNFATQLRALGAKL